jgi:hypothetical protein
MIRQEGFGLNRLGSVGFADPGPLGFRILESPSQTKGTPLPGAAELSLAVHVPKRPKSIEFYRILQKENIQRIHPLGHANSRHIEAPVPGMTREGGDLP